MRRALWLLPGLLLLTFQAPALAATLNLIWDDLGPTEEGYKVERAQTQAGPFVEVARQPGTTFSDMGLPDGVTRCYRVRAYNAGGDSGYSNTLCASTPPLASHLLTVVRAGSGAAQGLVTGTGIDCGNDCTETLRESTGVVLTAWVKGWGSQTGQHYRFTGWSGAPGCSNQTTCVVTMSQARTVTATFARR